MCNGVFQMKNIKPQIEGGRMEKRNLKLLYFSPDDSEIKNLNLGFSKLVISFVAIILTVILLTSVFSFVVIKFFNSYKITEYSRQNEILATHLLDVQNRMEKIQDEMKRIEKFDNDLHDLADLPRLDEDLRNVGIGGSVDFENFALRELPSPLSETSNEFIKDIGSLERKIAYQLESFGDITKKIKCRPDKISVYTFNSPCANW